jgi:hypothetical protein
MLALVVRVGVAFESAGFRTHIDKTSKILFGHWVNSSVVIMGILPCVKRNFF